MYFVIIILFIIGTILNVVRSQIAAQAQLEMEMGPISPVQ